MYRCDTNLRVGRELREKEKKILNNPRDCVNNLDTGCCRVERHSGLHTTVGL